MSECMDRMTARILAVIKQGLHQRPSVANKQTILETIRQIGFLQLDAINVVARSHYLVLLSRLGLYDPTDLDALLYPDRCLFEQWAHAACLIPLEHYAYFAPTILARREHPHRKLTRLGDDPPATLGAVLGQVHERGPLASRDFEDPRGRRGTWWDWKPAKLALQILFEEGYLMVDHRVNFQRYYDLAEHVLPGSSKPPLKTMDDWRRWATLKSVACLGVATVGQLSDYYRQSKSSVSLMIETLVTEGTVLPVEVEGWKETAYMDPADLGLVKEIEAGAYQPTLTTFLSPFDNLIWDRRRVRDLFSFDYCIEVYTPVAKRQRDYGYYVLPILHRGRLVGRLDPKSDRKSKTLIIHAIYLEPYEALTDALVMGIADALREFMTFHGSCSVVVEHSQPEALKALLLNQI